MNNFIENFMILFIHKVTYKPSFQFSPNTQCGFQLRPSLLQERVYLISGSGILKDGKIPRNHLEIIFFPLQFFSRHAFSTEARRKIEVVRFLTKPLK